VFDDLGTMPQVIDGRSNIRAACLMDQLVQIVFEIGREQTFHRRTHQVDDGVKIPRLILFRPLKLFQRGFNGTALRVPENDDKPRTKLLGGEFDATDLRWRNDVPGDANHEQVAEALIEYDFHRYARIRATKNGSEWLLPRSQLDASRTTG
jgi:hypothetical protein